MAIKKPEDLFKENYGVGPTSGTTTPQFGTPIPSKPPSYTAPAPQTVKTASAANVGASKTNADGEIINPTPQDIADFNSKFTTYSPATAPTVGKTGFIGGKEYQLDADGKPIGYTAPAVTDPTKNSTDNKVYGNGVQQQMYGAWGITPSTAPVLPKAADTVSEYGLNADMIRANLENSKAAIKAKYDVMRREAEKRTENERKSNIAGLYSLGEVNPMSSGNASIGSASDENLYSRMDSLTAAEAEETSNAVNQAFGFQRDAQTAARQQQLDTEKTIKDQQDIEIKTREDNVNQVKNAMSLVAAGKQLEQADKDNAWTGIGNLLTSFGSAAFEGADATMLSQMEKAAGIPSGTLSKGLQTLKEQELTGKKTEIVKGNDGSIYTYSQNADGTASFDKLIQGKEKAELSSGEQQRLLSIATKRNADSIIKAADAAQMGNQIADQILLNPKDSGSQLSLLYSLIKGLDPTSAVKEGELALAQSTQSYLEKFKLSFDKISKGKIISDAAAKALAVETKNLFTLWQNSARKQEDNYSALANSVGLGEAWTGYTDNFNPVYENTGDGTEQDANNGWF